MVLSPALHNIFRSVSWPDIALGSVCPLT